MILEKIRQLYPQFTKSQKKLADFIATHYQEAAFMTASELAHRLRLNEATVIRFAQRLDYSGYPELSASIQEIIKKELLARGQPLEAASTEDPFLRILANEDENLRRAVGHLALDLASEVLTALQEARKVYLLGQGVAAHLAGIFTWGLRAQGHVAELVSGDALNLAVALSDLGDEEVVIGFCVDEAGLEIANALKLAKQNGSRTVAFAHSSVSPVAQAADLALICPADGLFAFPSVTALAALIDAFLQLLATQDAERSLKGRERVRSAHQVLMNTQDLTA